MAGKGLYHNFFNYQRDAIIYHTYVATKKIE